MKKFFCYLVCYSSFALALSGCSTTEQEVDALIERLAAHEIKSAAWNQAVDELITIGRPAARQLIAHIADAHYVGENYREHRAEIEKIRTGCALALGRIKPRAASAALVGIIGSAFSHHERLACIWAVGEIGFDQASVDAVLAQFATEAFATEDPVIRLYNIIALIKMEDDSMMDEVMAAIKGADNELAEVALEGLEGANYFGVPLLVDIARSENPRQARAQEILGNLKGQLVDQLDDEDPVLRMNSARALGKIGDPSVQDRLVSLLKDPSNQVRFNAAASLAEMAQASGIDFLFDALRDQDPILRTNAVKFLTEVQRSSAVVEEQLLGALKHENLLSRSGAAQVLGQARVESAVQELLVATRDPVSEVRWNAVIALGHIRAAASRDRLRELRQDSDATVAYYAEWALLQLGQS